MGKFDGLARVIVQNVGGKANIAGLTHCVTRLRFRLKDESLVHTDVLEHTDGVMKVITAGGQYQVVIGQAVTDVYDAVIKVAHLEALTDSGEQEAGEESGNLIGKFVSTITAVFTPILGMLCACGMLKGICAALTHFGILTAGGGAYTFWYNAGDALFYFLPVLIAYTSAKKFKLNDITGLMIGLALCLPALVNLSKLDVIGTLFGVDYQIDFFGIPVILPKSGSYVQSVIPSIVAVWTAAKLEKLLLRTLPTVIKGFMTPFLVLVVIIPATFLVIGPVTTSLALGIGGITAAIFEVAPWLEGALLGSVWPLMVMFGLHWGISPIRYNNFSLYGQDAIVSPHFPTQFISTAACVAVGLKSKDKKVKAMCASAATSGLFGVTEPIIYGITLPRKIPFICSCIGGGVAGLIVGMYRLPQYSGGIGIFALTTFINPENGDMTGLYRVAMAIVVGCIVSFVLTMAFYNEEKWMRKSASGQASAIEKTEETETVTEQQGKEAGTECVVAAPVSGEVIALSDVEDEVFSAGVLGKGCAVFPDADEIAAPFDGTVMIADGMKHAVAVTGENGVGLIIHVGMNTVELDGKYFKFYVKNGEKVKKGQRLLSFEGEKIKAAGYSLVTPVVVTNSFHFESIEMLPAAKSHVTKGQDLLVVR